MQLHLTVKREMAKGELNVELCVKRLLLAMVEKGVTGDPAAAKVALAHLVPKGAEKHLHAHLHARTRELGLPPCPSDTDPEEWAWLQGIGPKPPNTRILAPAVPQGEELVAWLRKSADLEEEALNAKKPDGPDLDAPLSTNGQNANHPATDDYGNGVNR